MVKISTFLFATLFPCLLFGQDEETSKPFKKRLFAELSFGLGNSYITSYKGNSVPLDQESIREDYTDINSFNQANLALGYDFGSNTAIVGRLNMQNLNLDFRSESNLYRYKGRRGRASLVIRNYLNDKENALQPYHSGGFYYTFGTSKLLQLGPSKAIEEPFNAYGVMTNFGIRHESGFRLFFEVAADLVGNDAKMNEISINAGYDIYLLDIF